MKNNIDSSLITNRKIIIELRFNTIPKFLDVKGALLEKINSLKIINAADWTIGDSALKVSDSNDMEQVRNLVQVEINRISLISTKIDSIEKFVDNFSKLYNGVKEILGEPSINRIGCRIQGTYRTKSKTFEDVLKKFKDSFPNQIFLEEFPTTDLRLQIVYPNGTYHVGPLSENDPFLLREFKHSDKNSLFGFAIDTDNYLLRTPNTNLNSFSKIKDVITASLAVEKSLVEKLKDF